MAEQTQNRFFKYFLVLDCFIFHLLASFFSLMMGLFMYGSTLLSAYGLRCWHQLCGWFENSEVNWRKKERKKERKKKRKSWYSFFHSVFYIFLFFFFFYVLFYLLFLANLVISVFFHLFFLYFLFFLQVYPVFTKVHFIALHFDNRLR